MHSPHTGPVPMRSAISPRQKLPWCVSPVNFVSVTNYTEGPPGVCPQFFPCSEAVGNSCLSLNSLVLVDVILGAASGDEDPADQSRRAEEDGSAESKPKRRREGLTRESPLGLPDILIDA